MKEGKGKEKQRLLEEIPDAGADSSGGNKGMKPNH